jgi:hypothetical protein
MFGDEPQFGAEQLPDITTVKNIWRRAARCDGNKKLPESAWNNDVHSRVLDWVFRDSPTNDGLLDYRCWYAIRLRLSASKNTDKSQFWCYNHTRLPA